MKIMALSAKQIKTLQEIGADRDSANKTLNIALAFHSHRMTELMKTESDFWKELKEIHQLDTENKHYKTADIDGIAQIVEVKDKP